MSFDLIAKGILMSGESPAPYANMIVYPLTYDESDHNDTNTLTRQGDAPHVTPQGMKADGYKSRYLLTSLPAWLSSTGGKLSLSAKVRLYRQKLGGLRDIIVSVCSNDSSAYCKAEIVALEDTASGDPSLGFRMYDGAFNARYFGKNNWNYALPWPKSFLTEGVNKVRPQSLLFLDANTLIICGHYADTESRVYRIDLNTFAITGTFSFGTSTYRHVAAFAKRGNGEIWCVDYETSDALELDLDASFSSGNAVINTTWHLSNMGSNVLTGIEFISVGGTEYVLIALYHASATTYLYVIPTTEIADEATFALANRYKRFVIPMRCQGMALRPDDNLLYMQHNRTSGTLNTAPVVVVDIESEITSTADGGTVTEIRRHAGPSEFPEDIKFHPSTGEAWIGTEGRAGVVDNDGFLAYWRSPLTDNLPVEVDIRIDYNGSGEYKFYLDGHYFNNLLLTPSPTIGALAIGAPPVVAPGWTNGYALADVRSIALKDKPFTSAELAKLQNGTYEPSSLNVYVATLTNPGAETGDTSGWTNESGSLGVRSSNPAPRYEEGETNNNYFFGGANALTVARQRLAIATITGLSVGEIDTLTAAGDLWGRVDWWQANFDGTADHGAMGIRWLNSVPTQLSEGFAETVFTGLNKIWRRRTYAKTADNGARNIDALHKMIRTSGTNNDSYHDDAVMTIYTK